jgi:formate dehydrogenase subunit gamma
MAATTHRSEVAGPGPGSEGGRRRRFDRVERYVHWANATLFLTLIATGATLYIGALSTLVGRRELLRTIHVYSGLLLPLPLLAGALGPRWGRGLRDDARRINRWDRLDRRWLRSFGRDRDARPSKFNAGQKLNAAFTVGAIPVMLATGSIMRWFHPFPLAWRTGATFVHDSLFLVLVAAITGHILFALNDRDSLDGMLRGDVPEKWAKHHHPRWAAEEASHYRR